MLGDRYSQHNFAQVPDVKMARSQFDRSFTAKDTFNFDDLTPCFVDEILPGDTVNLTMETFARLATQKVPIMDNMYIDVYFFFVPNRLVWENWERFNGAQDDPGDSTDFILPTLQAPVGGFTVGSLYDKFGVPTGVAGYTLQSLPFRGYYLIWNEWFRDQNLQNSLVVPKDDGPDAPGDFVMQKQNKKHDYFTSGLPWPQKGPAVELPLGTSAPVIGIGKTNNVFGQTSPNLRESTGSNRTYAKAAIIDDTSINTQFMVEQNPDATGYPFIRADLSNATAATINQLRQAFSVQSLYELDARGGTRYVEILQAHFNVVSPDFRLQRPEYLGGGKIRINSHPVAQTTPTDGANPQAQLAAFATASSQGNGPGFVKSFVEHGYVIGVMCAKADLTYQQGLNRMWTRSTRFDFFWPKLQELGEQSVFKEEIYTQGTSADKEVLCYQERYAEYRYMPSQIRGQFRSTFAQSLDFWHMAEEFNSMPAFNGDFMKLNTPIERAIAVTDVDYPNLLIDMWFQYKHARPMMAYSVPATIGRF